MFQALDNIGITNFVLMKALEDATINGEKIFDRVERFGEDELIATKRSTNGVRMVINIRDMTPEYK